MIVYGRRATRLKTELLFERCPNCQSTNTVHMSIYQRYAHIFWIPMFPIGKTAVSVCSSCRQVLQLKQMPDALKLSFNNIKSGTKIPAWHFTGVLLVALSIVAIIMFQKHRDEKIAKSILNPKVNDVYEIEIKNWYTLYKVKKVVGDTVYFYVSKYQTDQESGLSDLADKEFATNETNDIPIHTLIDMNKKGEIIDIDRK